MNAPRTLRSFYFAGRGFARAWRTEPNLRLESVIGVVAVALALWLRAPVAPVALAMGLVLALELINSSIEAIVDLASPDHHELAGAAKDLAAAGVLVAAGAALVVGLAVLGPPLLVKLGWVSASGGGL